MEMYYFLKNNEDKYCFYTEKFGIISHQTATYSNGQTYQIPVYGNITTTTKYKTNHLYISIDDGTGKQEDLSAITMTIKDNCDCDCGYLGGTGIVYSFYMPISTYTSERNKILEKVVRFIGKIPKKSRNKLIKALYLYDIKKEKDFHSYERLFYRLSTRMGFAFAKRWITNESIRFTKIGPTYSIVGDRNRKLNKLFRNRKCT
jgi:hypothetical protein